MWKTGKKEVLSHKKKSIFSSNKMRNEVKLKIKHEIVKSKIRRLQRKISNKSLLGEIVSKQIKTNLHNMCKYVLLAL